MAYTKKRQSKRNRRYRGGFRYGNKSKHTPIPGEILISSPTSKTRTRTRTRTRNRTRKAFRFF